MAHFYGQIEGQARTLASRLGNKKKGIWAHIRGWDMGVKVVCWHDPLSKTDHIQVFETGGSHDPENYRMMGELTQREGVKIHVETNTTR